MVLEDKICGIEIKSDADTYTRLKTQIPDYDKYFDYNFIVVGTSHAMHVAEHVPDYWGIITVEETSSDGADIDIYMLRKPQVNPKMKWENKIGILWRPELVHIQELNDMPKYAQKSKRDVGLKILEMVDEEVLKKQFCDELFERDYDTIAQTINDYRQEKGQHKRRRRSYKRVRRKKNGK